MPIALMRITQRLRCRDACTACMQLGLCAGVHQMLVAFHLMRPDSTPCMLALQYSTTTGHRSQDSAPSLTAAAQLPSSPAFSRQLCLGRSITRHLSTVTTSVILVAQMVSLAPGPHFHCYPLGAR